MKVIMHLNQITRRSLALALALALALPAPPPARARAGRRISRRGSSTRRRSSGDMAAQMLALAVAELDNAEYRLHYYRALQQALDHVRQARRHARRAERLRERLQRTSRRPTTRPTRPARVKMQAHARAAAAGGRGRGVKYNPRTGAALTPGPATRSPRPRAAARRASRSRRSPQHNAGLKASTQPG